MEVYLRSREGVKVHPRGYYQRRPHIEGVPALHRKLQGSPGSHVSQAHLF